ncbi:MAG TPA: AsmA family protein [Nitrospinota bacterium]|nr:AsmA family protein [Nitrospinota bacterium]
MKEKGKVRLLKRFLIISLIILIIAGIVFFPKLIPTKWINNLVVSGLNQIFPQQFSLGNISITRLGHIRIDDVLIRETKEPLSEEIVSIKMFDINVRLIPLFKRQLSVEDLTIIEPKINIRRDTEKEFNFHSLFKKPFIFFVSKISLENGSLEYRDLTSGNSFELRKINIQAKSDDINSPINYKVKFEIIDKDKPARIKSKGSISLFKNGKYDPKNIVAKSKISFEGLDVFKNLDEDWLKTPFILNLKNVKGSLDINIDGQENIRSFGNIVIKNLDFKRPGVSEEAKSLNGLTLDYDSSYNVSLDKINLNRLIAKSGLSNLKLSGSLENISVRPFLNMRLDIEYFINELEKGSSRFNYSGKTSTNIKLNGSTDNLLIEGTTDLSDVEFSYLNSSIKEKGEIVNINCRLRTKEKDLFIENIALSSDSLNAQVSGIIKDFKRDQQIDIKMLLGGDSSKFFEKIRERFDKINVSGPIKNNLSFTGNMKNLTIKGSTDLNEFMVLYNENLIKASDEKAGLSYDIQLVDNIFSINKINLLSSHHKVELLGKIAFVEGLSRFDIRCSSTLNISDFQKILPLPKDLLITGVNKTEMHVKGIRKKYTLIGSMDLTNNEIAYKERFVKPLGVRNHISFNLRIGKDIGLNSLKIALDTSSLRIKGSTSKDFQYLDLNVAGKCKDLKPLDRFYSGFKETSFEGEIRFFSDIQGKAKMPKLKGSITFDNAVLKSQGKHELNIAVDGTIGFTPDVIITQNLRLLLNESELNFSTQINDYSLKPKVRFELEGGNIKLNDLSPFMLVKEMWLPISKSQVEDSNQNSDFLLNTDVYGKLSIKNLHANRYELNNLMGKMNLKNGVFNFEELRFGMNNGSVLIFSFIDFNKEKPEFKLKLDIEDVQANENLKPIIDYFLPPLHILNKVDFKANFKGHGDNKEEIIKSLYGNAKMLVDEGYIRGESAPAYVTVVFPFLQTTSYDFKTGEIVAKIKDGKSNLDMKFKGGRFDFYIIGSEDNLKNEIDFTFGVDLASGPLGIIKKTIPSAITKYVKVDIARIKGKTGNPKVYFFRPKIF